MTITATLTTMTPLTTTSLTKINDITNNNKQDTDMDIYYRDNTIYNRRHTYTHTHTHTSHIHTYHTHTHTHIYHSSNNGTVFLSQYNIYT